MQRTVLLPTALLTLLLALGAAIWLQQTQSVSAGPAVDPYYRDYIGTATVKVKNGAAWQSFPMQVCVTVETAGQNGDITDVIVGGDIEFDCYPEESDNSETSILGDSLDVSSFAGCGCSENTGSFFIDTKEDTSVNAGKGWKTPPTKQTASQWQFKLMAPLDYAAEIWLNDDVRPLTANTTFTVKFLNNRQGLYFKAAGFAPLNDNGLPKVTVEIESVSTGLDSPPTLIDININDSDTVDSDVVVQFTFDEPVNVVDTIYVGIDCFVGNTGFFYYAEYSNLTISGNGTNVIGLSAIGGLPYGADCYAYIYPPAIDDVDNNDPPEWGPFSGGVVQFFTSNPG